MNRTILLCALLTVSFSVMAEPFWWMKKDDHNTLGLFVHAGSQCPFNKLDLKKAVEGEYLRARIKPSELLAEPLLLQVTTACLKLNLEGGIYMGYAMHNDVYFTTSIDTQKTWLRYDDRSYGGMYMTGSQAKAYMLNQVQDDVSEALTDYLKANMK